VDDRDNEWLSYLDFFYGHYVALSTGTGKSYLACAIAHKACLLTFTVLFTKLSQLLDI